MGRKHGIGRLVRWCYRAAVTVVTSLVMITGLVVAVAPAQTATAADTGDFTLTLNASDLGIDPAAMREAVPQIQAEITQAGSLSGAIKQEMVDYPVVDSVYDTTYWVDFDGAVSLTADGTGMVMTVPAAEIQTSASWWEKFGAMVAGAVLGYGIRFLCIGGLTALGAGAAIIPLACTPLGGAVAGFVTAFITHAISKDLGTATAWRDIIIGTLIGAISGAVWEKWFAPWAKANLPTAFKNMGNWLAAKAPSLASRFGSNVGDAAQQSSAIMIELDDLLTDAIADWGGTVGSGQIVAVPSYINPAGDPAAWNTLIGSSSDKVGVAVANVLNGPGSAPVAAWTDVINRTHASGKRVLGYVDTGYLGQTGLTTRLGSTSPADWVAQIEEDVNAWYTMYGSSMDGIFFDDGYNQCGTGNQFPAIYEAINRYEKLKHRGAMTVLNPGAVVPQCYENSADILLTFEGSYATYESSAYQALDWTPSSPSKIWHIIYGVPADKVSLVDETSQTRGAGVVYITDDLGANPYDTMPGYWSAEQASVPGGTPGVTEAGPYVSGAALPTVPTYMTLVSSDYTSATVTWAAAADVANYLLYLDGDPVLSLPGSMTKVTIGGLAPGGSHHAVYVVAQGAGGDLSLASNPVGVITLALPGGQYVTNVKITHGAGTITYSADFLVPYSFRRVLISPPSNGELFWWPNGDTESCWFPGLTQDQLEQYGNFCGHWLIENSTLLVYAGTDIGQWSWTPVAYIPPTVNGYNYSWTVPVSDIGDAVDYIDMQGEGYGPLTNVISGVEQ